LEDISSSFKSTAVLGEELFGAKEQILGSSRGVLTLIGLSRTLSLTGSYGKSSKEGEKTLVAGLVAKECIKGSTTSGDEESKDNFS
jgi:hypothetical protein